MEDLVSMVVLGKEFVGESQNSTLLGFNNAKAFEFANQCVTSEDFFVSMFDNGENSVGMFIGFVAPVYFSNKLQAMEIVFYVEKEHRGSRVAMTMLDAFEEWAKTKGAVCVNMINLEVLKKDKIARFYSRRGYTPVENTFMKEL